MGIKRSLVGALAAVLVAWTMSATAAQAPDITNPNVARPLRQAMQAASTFNFPEALALADVAKKAAGINAAETAYINRLMREWTEISMNPEAIDEEIAEQLKEGRRSIGLLKNCADIAIVLTKAGKVATCPDAVAVGN
jgi:hypothetical protein